MRNISLFGRTHEIHTRYQVYISTNYVDRQVFPTCSHEEGARRTLWLFFLWAGFVGKEGAANYPKAAIYCCHASSSKLRAKKLTTVVSPEQLPSYLVVYICRSKTQGSSRRSMHGARRTLYMTFFSPPYLCGFCPEHANNTPTQLQQLRVCHIRRHAASKTCSYRITRITQRLIGNGDTLLIIVDE